MVLLPFRDREDAARQLASALDHLRGSHPVVLAIPRGAVPMGRTLAHALDGDLDVVLVRKIGAPGNPELAIGAVDERGSIMLTEHAAWLGADDEFVREEAEKQLALIADRRARYRKGRPGLPLAGRTVVVLDDGLATGSTMIAALRAVRAQHPRRVVCAVPVASRQSLEQLTGLADEIVCLATPPNFRAVGQFYRDFSSVDDAQVIRALEPVGRDVEAARKDSGSQRHVRIPADGVMLEGDLVSPPDAAGLVVFVHGSGSSRRSTRNRFVARALNEKGLSTLLFDLLTAAEDNDPAARFDVPLLADRLGAALDWVLADPACSAEGVALFGASTGAAAALRAAAHDARQVVSVVSRGGRPDLAGPTALQRVASPTLLIVGGADHAVLELNRTAMATMAAGVAELAVVPGATHLFEEPGALERVAELAGDWFLRWFAAQPHAPQPRGRPERVRPDGKRAGWREG